MLDIIRLIYKEKNQIEQELLKKNERLEFYQNFFKNYNCCTLDKVLKVNHSDLAIAIILNQAPTISVQDTKDMVYSNRAIFESLTIDTIKILAALIDNLKDDPEAYQITKQTLTSSFKKTRPTSSKQGLLDNMLQNIIKILETTPEAFFKFVDQTVEYPKPICTALTVVATLKVVAEEKDMHYQMIDEITAEEDIKVKSKVQDKWVLEELHKSFDIANLLKPISSANSEYHLLEFSEKKKKQNLLKTLKVYEQLEQDLFSAITQDEITRIDSLIKKVPSPEIRVAILKLIYHHNQEVYEELNDEYKKLIENDSTHYQVLLAKNGISPDAYDVGTVMKTSIEELTQMLNILTKMKITEPNKLLFIAQNSNLETVSNLHALFDRGIITKKLLDNCSMIFNDESKEYEDFMRNLDFINKRKLNPYYFTQTEEILITPHKKLAGNIKVLEDYHLTSNMKTGINLSFLAEGNLEPAIDTLLELGYEKNLEECLELLNYKDKFDRLKVLKELNIKPASTEELIEVLTTSKFYVPDDEINNYVYNAAPYRIPREVIEAEEPRKILSDTTRISQFVNSERTYDFNGVIISQNKVHRTLSHVLATGNPTNRLIYAILKYSTLNDDETETVINCVNEQKLSPTVKEKK